MSGSSYDDGSRRHHSSSSSSSSHHRPSSHSHRRSSNGSKSPDRDPLLSALQSVQDQATKSQMENQTLKKQLEAQAQQIASLTNELNQEKSKSQGLEVQLKTLRAKNEEIRKTRESFAAKNKDLEKENEELKSENDEMKDLMVTLDTAVSELQPQVEELKTSVEEKEKAIASKELELTTLRENKKFMEERNQKLLSKCEKLKTQSEASSESKGAADEALRKEIAEKKNEISTLLKRFQGQENVVKNLKISKTRAEENVKQGKNEISRMRVMMDDLKASANSERNQSQKLKDDLKKLTAACEKGLLDSQNKCILYEKCIRELSEKLKALEKNYAEEIEKLKTR